MNSDVPAARAGTATVAPPRAEPAGHICLSGMMGTGKSTVGAALARRMSRPFVDLDASIEFGAGMGVPAIFAAEGETGFRQREAQTLRRVLSGPPAVIALGGGAVLRADNRRAIRAAGRLVTLHARARTLGERLATATDRPLLTPDETGHEAIDDRLARLMSERAEAYADADTMVDTEGRTPDEVVDVLMAWVDASARVEAP